MELSTEAQALFRLHVERMGKIAVDDRNVQAYRELERAGLVLLGRPFPGEPRYHLTRAGYERKLAIAPSPAESASPRP